MHWVLVVVVVALALLHTVVAVVMHLVATQCSLVRRTRSLLAREENARHRKRRRHLLLRLNDETQAMAAELQAKALQDMERLLARAADDQLYELKAIHPIS
jgi:ABC-type transport system involved in cytochrome bd biosynthesis fused ATPase/permease subunit